MPSDLTIVVVTHNSAHVVGDLLDSVEADLRKASAKVLTTVVVVDNGSTDATLQVLAARSDCVVVQAENRGYSAGLNTGFRAAPDCAAVMVLNPDVRLRPGTIGAMVEALARSGVGIVAPMVLNEDGTLSRSLRREPSIGRASGLAWTRRSAFSEYVDDPQEYRCGTIVDWALGAVLMISSECYRALGGWDESYFSYSEETDLCLRARDHGYLTYFEPAATATHIGGQSGQSPATHAMQIVNRVRLFRRRHRMAPSVVYYLVTIPSELSWCVRGHYRQSGRSVVALLWPPSRPEQLGCEGRLMPV